MRMYSNLNTTNLPTTSSYISSTARNIMETLDWAVENLSTVLLTGVVVAVAGVIVLLVKPDPEVAVEYNVPLPPQCAPGWTGEVLKEPGLKVSLHISVLEIVSYSRRMDCRRAKEQL